MECFLTLSDPSRPAPLVFSSRCTKRLFARILNDAIQASSPIPSRGCQPLESVQKLAVKFVKGLRHGPYETALQRLQLFSLVRRRIRGNLICMYKIMHGLLDFNVTQSLLPPPTLGFEVILSSFTNSGVRPVATTMRSAFE